MTGTVAAWSPLVLLILGLWAVALVRLVRVPAVLYLPRWVWAVLILAMHDHDGLG